MRFGLMAASAACVVAMPAAGATYTGTITSLESGQTFVNIAPPARGRQLQVDVALSRPVLEVFVELAYSYFVIEQHRTENGYLGPVQTTDGLNSDTYRAIFAALPTDEPNILWSFGPIRLGGFLLDGDSGSPINYTLTVTSLGAIPEPATWALMILGFGAVGGAMRIRRHRYGTVVR